MLLLGRHYGRNIDAYASVNPALYTPDDTHSPAKQALLAAAWYRCAAELGSRTAQWWYASVLHDDATPTRDALARAACLWIRRCASSGDADALRTLTFCFAPHALASDRHGVSGSRTPDGKPWRFGLNPQHCVDAFEPPAADPAHRFARTGCVASPLLYWALLLHCVECCQCQRMPCDECARVHWELGACAYAGLSDVHSDADVVPRHMLKAVEHWRTARNLDHTHARQALNSLGLRPWVDMMRANHRAADAAALKAAEADTAAAAAAP